MVNGGGLKKNNMNEKQQATLELKKLDCNCNDCFFFKRDVDKTKKLNNNPKIKACKIHYGHCEQFDKEVGEIANILLLHTQECFIHRKEPMLYLS